MCNVLVVKAEREIIAKFFLKTLLARTGMAKSLILRPVAALLGIGNALLLLITNEDCTEESETAGFAGKQIALTVHENGSLSCATG